MVILFLPTPDIENEQTLRIYKKNAIRNGTVKMLFGLRPKYKVKNIRYQFDMV